MAEAVAVELRGARPRSAHVTLIRPPVLTIPGSLSTHGPTPPIGLAYIAAVLREVGHHVSVVDAAGEGMERLDLVDSPVGPLQRRGLPLEEVVDRIPADTDLIGVTLMFVHEWPQARQLLAMVRERFPHVPIVAGGETATSFWKWMFEQTDAIDYVVLGEGELTAVELVDRVLGGESVEGLDGVVAREPSGVVRSSGLPRRMRKLDAVPRPAWDLFPLDAYFRKPFLGVDRGRSMPILATRGCPYKCSFCSSPQMWTTRYVVRDPDDVVEEIVGYVKEHSVRNINFCDLTAITKRRWTLDFCDALERAGLEITWQIPVGTRAEALDAEVLRRLYETGCRNIVYAPESGSERMLELFDKKVELPHILESLRAAHRIGLRTHVNVIIGHPEERWGDLAKSFVFLLRAAMAGCDDCAPIIFCPYPGSADFERLVADGRLVVDEAACFLGLARSSSAARSFNPRMSGGQLRVAQLVLLASFYLCTVIRRPSRVLEFLRSLVAGTETTYLDQMVRSIREGRRSRRALTGTHS
jgi:anaerobic magnesium-protoporphyrin IX monomethyl ester cyclase